jgi:hypothetical protein
LNHGHPRQVEPIQNRGKGAYSSQACEEEMAVST